MKFVFFFIFLIFTACTAIETEENLKLSPQFISESSKATCGKIFMIKVRNNIRDKNPKRVHKPVYSASIDTKIEKYVFFSNKSKNNTFPKMTKVFNIMSEYNKGVADKCEKFFSAKFNYCDTLAQKLEKRSCFDKVLTLDVTSFH